MTLKEKLAEKYVQAEIDRTDGKVSWSEELKAVRPELITAYLAGFNRAKALYVDFAKRFDPRTHTPYFSSVEMQEKVAEIFEKVIGEEY